VSEAEIAQIWDSFVAVVGAAVPAEAPEAWAFGPDGDPELQIHLAHLAASGTKRATTSILDDYADEPLPRPGDYCVILDGSGRPTCIVRTTRVEVRRFGDVDAAFADAEGEGDRTLSYWRRSHLESFAAQGRDVIDHTRVVL
jgi:uncharacterized protein YhfF